MVHITQILSYRIAINFITVESLLYKHVQNHVYVNCASSYKPMNIISTYFQLKLLSKILWYISHSFKVLKRIFASYTNFLNDVQNDICI